MTEWQRVSKSQPCEVCGRPDWCTRTMDSYCCMRIESDRPLRNGGWLHRLGRSHPIVPVRTPTQPKRLKLNVAQIVAAWEEWNARTGYRERQGLAESLGVGDIALEVLGAAWASDHNAWAFPMRADDGQIIGIRFRGSRGKWALGGSRAGLFLPHEVPAVESTLYICEGPTDTAAALTLGMYAIGRPSCRGQEAMVNAFITRNRFRRAVIVADNDSHGAGVDGAEHLRSALLVPSCVLIPPTKDLRELVAAGYDHSVIQSLVSGLCWTNGES